MSRHPLAATAVAYFLFALLVAVTFSGCAALGVPAADTFNKKAAAATQSVNAASQMTLTLLQARKITPDEADAFIDRAEEAQQAVDFARSIYANDPAGGQDALAKAIAVLTVLTSELERRR